MSESLLEHLNKLKREKTVRLCGKIVPARITIDEVLGLVEGVVCQIQDEIEDFKAEIDDQKYNLAPNKDVTMFVIDIPELETAIKNLEINLKALLVGSKGKGEQK